RRGYMERPFERSEGEVAGGAAKAAADWSRSRARNSRSGGAALVAAERKSAPRRSSRSSFGGVVFTESISRLIRWRAGRNDRARLASVASNFLRILHERLAECGPCSRQPRA